MLLGPDVIARLSSTSQELRKARSFKRTIFVYLKTLYQSQNVSTRTWAKKVNTFSINMADNMARIDRHKLLGLSMDFKLFFSHHQQLASKAALRSLNLIHRSFTRISADKFLIVNGIFIQTHLELRIKVVRTALARVRKALEKVQITHTKIIFGFIIIHDS